MDKIELNEAKAQIILNEENKRIKLLEEFEELGKNKYSNKSRFVLGTVFLIFFATFLFFDADFSIMTKDYLSSFLIAVVLILSYENRKVNRRIDILYKIVKHDSD